MEPRVLFSTVFTDADLVAAAQALPQMPTDTSELISYVEGLPTFTAGTPFNDLGITLLDTDYVDGENGGYDTFLPVDPSDPLPGTGEVKYIRTVLNIDLDASYDAAPGDRIILGTDEIDVPFFSIGPDGIDNDYAVIQHFDYEFGAIQLRGTADDYELRRYDASTDGVATSGYYLFYTGQEQMAQPDLIAFIFEFDDVALPVSGNAFRDPTALGNGTGVLDLNDPAQFIYAQPLPTTPAIENAGTQVGTDGKEIVEAVAIDQNGNTYLAGATDGTFIGSPEADHRLFVTQTLADGTAGWTTELEMAEGSTLKAAIADDEFLYVAGRTLDALPGFTNAGRWDGILLKLRLDDGTIVATDQWGNAGIDGYGNLELDDAGHLFVSGQGSPPGQGGTDDLYLVAKHRTSDLGNVWRQIDPTVQQGFAASAEAWGGLTFVQDEGESPGEGRLVVAGWVLSFGGANAFAAVYEDLNATTPIVAESIIIAPPGTTADWVLDSVVDSAGNIYLAGYTTGSLDGPHQGEGDAFIIKYDANLANPVFRQFGTEESDMFRYLEIDADDNIYATGYTYADLAGTNADPSGRTGDVVVYKFDTDLNVLASTQFGTVGEDRGITDFYDNQLIIGGMTEAALVGTSQGSFDGFVLTLDTDLQIVATPTVLPGDYNGSGQVEQGDLNLVLNNWGKLTDATGVPENWVNDLPDSQIDQNELNRVLTNWGRKLATPAIADSSRSSKSSNATVFNLEEQADSSLQTASTPSIEAAISTPGRTAEISTWVPRRDLSRTAAPSRMDTSTDQKALRSVRAESSVIRFTPVAQVDRVASTQISEERRSRSARSATAASWVSPQSRINHATDLWKLSESSRMHL